MNENQTTYPTGAQDEEEIDLVALMVTLLHKLKPILLTAVVCAVLFGGFAGIKAIRGADKDTLKAQRLEDEEYQQKKRDYEEVQALYKQNVDSNTQQQQNAAAAVERTQEYMEKSVLNNLDPYNVWNAKTDLYISTGYQIMPGMSYQNPDRTGAVLAAYSSALNDGAILNEIAAQVGTEANYLRELVSVDYSTYSQILTITVMGEDPEFVDGVMEALLGQMEAVKGNITDIISSHTVTTIARSSYNSVSTSLMDRQKANTDQLTELENRIEALQLDRQKLDNAFQTDTDAWNNVEEPVIGGAASSLAKYLLIGFLLGGVLACGVVVVRFLLDGMVYSASELNRSTGLPVLGALASDRTKKAGKLDAKLYQMEGRPDGSADAEMLCLMAQTIRSRAPEAKKILVTGDLPADQLEALAAALQATEPLRGQSVTAAESILKAAATVPHVVAADAIVLAADCTVTRTDAVREQNEKILRLGKQILGCIVYE